MDTYCKVAACKLYTSKTPITAADLLNDRVLPMLEDTHQGKMCFGRTLMQTLREAHRLCNEKVAELN